MTAQVGMQQEGEVVTVVVSGLDEKTRDAGFQDTVSDARGDANLCQQILASYSKIGFLALQ